MNKEGKEMFALTLDQAVKKELRKILKKVRRHFKKSKQIEFNLFG